LLPNVQFYTNSANLLPYSIQSIQELADYMAAHPNANAVIKGHTDDVGDADANLKLSQARAETVKQVLVSFGIASERIEAKGFGERMPKTRDQTFEARAIHRRVEVELTNTDKVETKRTEKKAKNGN
jgi:K(+)-stimulated pyrophosphate-energized sodium pump